MGLTILRSGITTSNYAAFTAGTCPIFTVEHPDGAEKTPPISPPVQCLALQQMPKDLMNLEDRDNDRNHALKDDTTRVGPEHDCWEGTPQPEVATTTTTTTTTGSRRSERTYHSNPYGGEDGTPPLR